MQPAITGKQSKGRAMKRSQLVMDGDFLLTTKECSVLLRISRTKFIREFLETATMPFVKFDNRVLIRRADLNRFIDDHLYIVTIEEWGWRGRKGSPKNKKTP